MEKEQKLAFLGTGVKEGGEIIAYVGNIEKLGDSGVRSLREAFRRAASTLTIKDGVVVMTEKALRERIDIFEEKGQVDNMKAFMKALETIDKKKNGISQKNVVPVSKLAM
ncbi:MAG: hypothetical protein V1721_03160 [Pseudomonadota bacterium]